MTAEEANELSERFLLALDLFEFGVQMMRQNLKRQHPDSPAEEIDDLLYRWLSSRPCAPTGDAAGLARPAGKQRT